MRKKFHIPVDLSCFWFAKSCSSQFFFRSNDGQLTTHKEQKESEDALKSLEHPNEIAETSKSIAQHIKNQAKNDLEKNHRNQKMYLLRKEKK